MISRGAAVRATDELGAKAPRRIVSFCSIVQMRRTKRFNDPNAGGATTHTTGGKTIRIALNLAVHPALRQNTHTAKLSLPSQGGAQTRPDHAYAIAAMQLAPTRSLGARVATANFSIP